MRSSVPIGELPLPLFSQSLSINGDGVVLGANTALVRMTNEGRTLAFDDDRERLFALLAVAFRRPAVPDILSHLKAAATHWENGDKALANLRLVFAGLPRMENPVDAMRLCLAGHLLDHGMSPHVLLKELQLTDVTKFDPDQPRYPAGSGRQSGEWRSVTGSFEVEIDQPASNAALALPAVASAPAVAEVAGTLAQGLFAVGTAASEFVAGLGALAGGIGTGIVAGAIIVPSPNSVTTEGSLPGDPNTQYALDNPTGVLRLTRNGAGGTELIALAHRGNGGIFYESETGTPIARVVGGSLVFDAASLADVAPQVQPQTRTIVQSESQAVADTARQLCPDPGPDWPHSASVRAIAYQAQISALNNPERPLPPGLAMSLPDPATGRRVVFDDCRESDGTMIEAKGPGYDKLLQSNYLREIVLARWSSQASRQMSASLDRNVEWYFAEAKAASFANERLHSGQMSKQIRILTVPAIIQ